MRPLPSCGVCLSVCPSVTFMYYVETSERILELFSPSGSHTVLVFSLPWVLYENFPYKIHGNIAMETP